MASRVVTGRQGLTPNATTEQIARHIGDVVMQGHLNNTLNVTLPVAPAATFTVSDARIGPNSWVQPMATDAASLQAKGNFLVASRMKGSMVIEFTTTTATAVPCLAFLDG